MDFEITKKEIIVSISIIIVMLLLGIFFGSMIFENRIDQNEIYNKALKISNKDLFVYGMDTNVGPAFVYGKLQPVDTVSYPGLEGKFYYIKKSKKDTLCTLV